MSICNDSRAHTYTNVVNTASCADTAAATSGWIDVRSFKGDLVFIQHSGAITGTLNGKLQGADDSGGTNGADITGATFTAVSAANKAHTCTIQATQRPFIKYVGTVVTGPVLLSVVMVGNTGQAG